MKNSISFMHRVVPTLSAIAICFVASSAMAGGGDEKNNNDDKKHNTYVFIWNDKTDSLTGSTYKNGNLISTIFSENEQYNGLYKLWDNGTLKDDINVKFNIYEPNSKTLSDTLSIFGKKSGEHENNDDKNRGGNLMLSFNSDVDGHSLLPLPHATSIFETGTPQTVLQFSAKNGDMYKFQFVSDVPAVPEPETYMMMLSGLGILAFLARNRKS